MNVSFAPLRPDAVSYLTARIGIDYSSGAPFGAYRWFCTTARDDEGRIACVVLGEFLNQFDIQFNVAVDNPRAVTRRLMRAIFTALFTKATRLTAIIDVDNTHSIRSATRMGFKYEGTSRCIINGHRDGHIFGMLRQDCRFLGSRIPQPIKEPGHGWTAKNA